MIKYLTSVLINNMSFYVLLGYPLKIVEHTYSRLSLHLKSSQSSMKSTTWKGLQ